MTQYIKQVKNEIHHLEDELHENGEEEIMIRHM